ncbi:sorting and assembly machinery component 50 [Blomia tropicalis]|nr:sorting and assembly machinery component 50 [Blomia tropicalis]
MASDEGNRGDDIQTVSSADIRTRVDAVHFDGLTRTKHDILRELVKPIFETRDIGEVIQQTNKVRQRFHELGLFRNISVSIEEAKSPPIADPNLSNLAITFDVEETRRYAGGIFTSAGNNDASVILELRSPNLLGRGEEIQGRFEHSWKYFSSWSTSFSRPLIKPLWPSKMSRFDITILQATKDAPWSGYRQLDRGFFADLNIQQNDHHHHLIRWDSTWRYLTAASIDTDTSFKIREQLGHSLKSSLSHIYTFDHRDHPVLPTRGFMFKLLNEYAGFHKDGGVSFLKHEIEAQHNVSISKLILQATCKFGLLTPRENVLVSDKFFLGGPLNLRGFHMNRIGPHNKNSALGANAYWVGGLHAYLPLPFRNAFNECLRVHGFLNAGNINDKIDLQMFQQNVRLSAGVGLVMSFGNKVRLEFSYCIPLRSDANDKSQRGLQYGIGIDYI